MTVDTVKAVVTKADDNAIRVKVYDKSIIQDIEKIGFFYNHDSSDYVMHVFDDNEKASVFNALRDLKVGFSAGKEWCPSEVFEYLRDIGLLTGTFCKVAWVSPGKVRLITT
ncbi:MAG: hypothetical protein EA349_15495 [Halomonadaceae bacterium]|nr:MAG: hypothetical protein EA349_15495 [Halomonadaceae bacterium]